METWTDTNSTKLTAAFIVGVLAVVGIVYAFHTSETGDDEWRTDDGGGRVDRRGPVEESQSRTHRRVHRGRKGNRGHGLPGCDRPVRPTPTQRSRSSFRHPPARSSRRQRRASLVATPPPAPSNAARYIECLGWNNYLLNTCVSREALHPLGP